VLTRYRSLKPTVRCDLEIFISANSVIVHNDSSRESLVTDDLIAEFQLFWNTILKNPNHQWILRDTILRSFCPQIFGMRLVKLAVLLTLLGGVGGLAEGGMKVRGEGHLLLVGDPGNSIYMFISILF